MEGLRIFTKGFTRPLMLAVTMWAGIVGPVGSEPGNVQEVIDSVARICSSPEQLARFLNESIRFQSDEQAFGLIDYWQTPEEFIHRKGGDCEDYALFSQAVLRQQGLESFVFSLYGKGGYAHTVCVFKDGAGYNILNQDRVLRCDARSLEELAGFLYADWKWGAVAERAGHRGRAVKIIRRG